MGRHATPSTLAKRAVEVAARQVDHVSSGLQEKLASNVRVLRNGCWKWTGPVDMHGAPYVYLGRKGRKAKLGIVKRLFLEAAGFDVGTDRWGPTCGTRQCVNPYHQQVVGKDWLADEEALPVLEEAVRYRRKIRQLQEEMRERGLTTSQLAKSLGLTKTTVIHLLQKAEKKFDEETA